MMEEDRKQNESQKKCKYRHISSENLLNKSKLIRRRRHRKLTEKFLAPLQIPFDSSVCANIMSRGDSAANTGYKLNPTTIRPQTENTKKVLTCRDKFESQPNANYYKKINQNIIEAYYNVCARKSPGIKQFVSKSCSECLTPKFEESLQTQLTENEIPHKPPQTIKKRICDNSAFLEFEQHYSDLYSPNQNHFISTKKINVFNDSFLEPPGFKYHGCSKHLENNLNKCTTEYSSTDLSECQINCYKTRNHQNPNIKDVHENNDSSESHLQFRSAINIISSETSSSENEKFYEKKIFQNLTDDSSDIQTDDDAYHKNLNDSWTTVSSVEATKMLNITTRPHPFLNNYSQLNQEHSLSDVIIKTLKLERNQKYNRQNTESFSNDCNDTSRFTKKLITCMAHSMSFPYEDKPEFENIKEHLKKESHNEKEANCKKTKNEIGSKIGGGATPGNKTLHSKIREVKQSMPTNSPMQALIEVCGAQSHITEILNKTTKNLQNGNKFQKLDPRFRTIRKTEHGIKIADGDSDKVCRFSKNVLEKPLQSEDIIKEYDTNNSIKSYKTALQHSLTENEFNSQQHLSLHQFKEQLRSSDLFPKTPTEIKSNKHFYNLQTNVEKHFRELDETVNNIKNDITQLLLYEKMIFYGKIENKSIREPLDCEQLYKKFTEIEYIAGETNSDFKAIKSCVGSGFAISFILLLCLMCGSIVSDCLK